MKKNHRKLLLLLITATLAACGGGNTQYVYYSPVDNTPKLDMKAAVYKALLPSGNTLTITTDQSDINVYGAYTIKNGSTIVSSGKVGNLVTQLSLSGFPGSPCPAEAISVVPVSGSISAARDAANVTISGFSCSEASSLPTTKTISKLSPPATAYMFSSGAINPTQNLSVTVFSGDNVNFVGSLNLVNTSLPATATGTIIGTITNLAAGPATAAVVDISDPSAYGFVFTRATNFSGHFFALNDNISAISGQVRTTSVPLGGQYFINEVTASVTDNSAANLLGPVAIPYSSNVASYTPL